MHDGSSCVVGNRRCHFLSLRVPVLHIRAAVIVDPVLPRHLPSLPPFPHAPSISLLLLAFILLPSPLSFLHSTLILSTYQLPSAAWAICASGLPPGRTPVWIWLKRELLLCFRLVFLVMDTAPCWCHLQCSFEEPCRLAYCRTPFVVQFGVTLFHPGYESWFLSACPSPHP